MNNSKYKITIIMPAYNVANYIARGIESVLNQTYTNFELIITNDGSQDQTEEIIHDYARKDSRIKLISQNNKGVSSARNVAIDASSGDYLICLDGDDWLESNILDYLLNLAVDNPNYIIACNRTNYFEDEKGILKKKPFRGSNQKKVIGYEEAVNSFLTGEYGMMCAQRKMYPMDIIKRQNIRFNTNISHGEDGLFVYQTLQYCPGFIYDPIRGWNFLARVGSATHSGFTEKLFTALDAVDIMIESEQNIKVKQSLEIFKYNRLVSIINRYYISDINKSEFNRRIRYEMNNCFRKVSKYNISIKTRIWMLIYTIVPRFVVKFYIKEKVRRVEEKYNEN